ncbi:hypothetical protein [Lacrimispora indolis]|uniref:hypothetical protein n=1 Tax=Lacrimispora indolis TaxID=69825 RepID=UPI0004066776|nr:hypothetical protein [[Clostridium] methoxybenzovorans]
MVNQEMDNQLLQSVKELIEKCIPMSDMDYEAFKVDRISKVDGQADSYMMKFHDELIRIIDICRMNEKEIPGAATPRESK